MDIDKITAELNRRFGAELPEFYTRRLIFWHDEEAEFKDQISELHLQQAKILVLTGKNYFAAKKLLNVDDTESNYLVYAPGPAEAEPDNWLLDMELYSEVFRADLISLWMEEMGLGSQPLLRTVVKGHRKFFNSKERRKKTAACLEGCAGAFTPVRLQLAILGVLCGIRDPKPEKIIREVLKNGLTQAVNTVYQSLENYGMEEVFWTVVKQGTGYQDAKPDLGSLAVHILLTATTGSLPPEVFNGLEQFLSPQHQVSCYTFVSDWLHSDEAGEMQRIASKVEREVRLPERLLPLKVEQLLETDLFPCVDRLILEKIMESIKEKRMEPAQIRKAADERRTSTYYDRVRYFYDGVLQIAEMQLFYLSHGAGFHETAPEKIWEGYTSSWYKMDTWYRLFYRDYEHLLQEQPDDGLFDLFKESAVEAAERLYTRWFLGNLGSCWTTACEEALRTQGMIPGLPQQTDFYRQKAAGAASKIYVVISDALRYEVAVSLKEQLERETQSDVRISAMEGIFPTITKFGMAALLPHKKLSVELKKGRTDRLAVLADGLPTDAGSRDKLLKAAHRKSVAVKYTDLVQVKRAERQAMVRGMDIVYIYHDTIDAAGHQEKSIFKACDEAITELKNTVRMITNEFGSTNIYITSDHGFLYTPNELTDMDKVDQGVEQGKVVEVGRRYAIMEKGAAPDYLLPVKFLGGDTPYEGFAARENIRIKVKGAGTGFVHGGISLEEMAVPVVEYHFLRNDSSEYRKNRSKYDTRPVTVNILSATRKVSNTTFSLDFYQKDAVGPNREAAVYQLYFADQEGRILSNVARLIADKSDPRIEKRVLHCSFTLKPARYDARKPYYLITADANGQEKSRLEFQIDIAPDADELDYFS